MLESAFEDLPVVGPSGIRRDGIVETIVSNVTPSGAGITGILMDGYECGAALVEQDCFGAIAVVHVKIINSHPLCAGGESFQNRDGSRAQVAKTHRLIARRVMAR